ncbi:MAG: hypothetical protein M1832_005153 [Thelocarpon impressellum]|nr:MAG: hypothetical protein M1832_005153 [Thelocarpon impressellum]
MSLMRDALQALPTQLIPDVYGWASAAEGQGWILQQFMPGRILDTEFSHMTLDDKTSILHQMAEIISKLQHHPLPGGIDQYGGVGFDDAGDIISGPMTIIRGGPYATYEDYYRDTLRLRLAEADENPVVQGWRRQGLRERVDRFMTHGIGPIMQQVDSRKALIHGDFTTNNLLVDPGTRRLTAVLDFDWAQVSGIGEEFLRSLGDIQGQLPGRLAEDEDQVLLRQALLNGFEPPVPSLPSTFLSAWTIAEAWDAELARCDAQRPSTIRGMAGLSELKWLSDNLCPFLLFNETIAAQRNEEQQANDRDRTEGLLSRFLRHHGY